MRIMRPPAHLKRPEPGKRVKQQARDFGKQKEANFLRGWQDGRLHRQMMQRAAKKK